jgi:hypothetical protein
MVGNEEMDVLVAIAGYNGGEYDIEFEIDGATRSVTREPPSFPLCRRTIGVSDKAKSGQKQSK